MHGYKFYAPEAIPLIKLNQSPYISIEESGRYAIARFNETSQHVLLKGLSSELEDVVRFLIDDISQQVDDTRDKLVEIDFRSNEYIVEDLKKEVIISLVFKILDLWTKGVHTHHDWLKYCKKMAEKFDARPAGIWASFKGGVQSVNLLNEGVVDTRWFFPGEWEIFLVDCKVNSKKSNYDHESVMDLLSSLAINLCLNRQNKVGLLLNGMGNEEIPLVKMIAKDEFLKGHIFGGIYNGISDKHLFFTSNSAVSERMEKILIGDKMEFKKFTIGKGARKF